MNGSEFMKNYLTNLKTYNMKAKIDTVLNKLISRKLMVFLVGCVALFSSKLDSSDWVIVATVYIGAQMATDIVERLMKVKIPKQVENVETEKG